MKKYSPAAIETSRMIAPLLTVEVDNKNCVVLKVKPDHKMDMIATGYLYGDETMFRLTKGVNTTCTVFRDGVKPYSWDWGLDGHTVVSEAMSTLGRALHYCVENHFHINVCKY